MPDLQNVSKAAKLYILLVTNGQRMYCKTTFIAKVYMRVFNL